MGKTFTYIIDQDHYILYEKNKSTVVKNNPITDYDEVFIFRKLISMSSSQFISWVNLSDWFDDFEETKTHVFPILFYSGNKIYVCNRTGGYKEIDINNENWLIEIPNKFSYVINVDKVSSKQFNMILSKKWTPKPEKKPQVIDPVHQGVDTYIRCKSYGNVIIHDVHLKSGQPLQLDGKYYFVNVKDIKEDELNKSKYLKKLIDNKKVEFVPEDVYLQFKDKYKPHHNALIIDKSVSKFVENGPSDIPEILVE